MNRYGGEAILSKDLIKHNCAIYSVDEDDYLIELERVEEISELLDLFLLLKLNVVLLETVKGEL